jgi:hypothetical protein
MRSLAAGLVSAALLVPALAGAHDLWLERSGEGFVLRSGHRGGALLAIDPRRVKAIRCTGGGGTRDVLADAAFSPREVRLAGRCDAISAFLDAGFYSLTPDGEVNLPRDEVRDAVKSWESRQFAKWVDARSPAAGEPLGDELEIVPASDLARVRRGDKIAVRVLYRGEPAPGAVVGMDHRPIGETDSKGVTRLRVRSAGVESLTASLRRPISRPEADAVVLEASLTFEVAR